MEVLDISCPQCGHHLQLRDRSLLGQAARCPECRHKFLLEERAEISRSEESLSGHETLAPGQMAESMDKPSIGSQPSLKEFGRYQLLRELGQGAMGTVYLARDVQLGRQVALKMPKFGNADNSEVLERFYREARAAATLRHSNICPVYDVGEVNGAHYLSMAFVQGHSLASYIDRDHLPQERQVVGIVRKLTSALDHAHTQGVVHRDLKPANIMIDHRNEPIVMDFGLARKLESGKNRLTQTGTILGTPAYMSPEQIRAEWDRIGPPSDIYSLGVILYELLTGEIPFPGPVGVVMAMVLTQPPPKPTDFRTNLDPRLETICLRMMSKKIDDRYTSMREVDDALAEFQRSQKETPHRTDTAVPFASKASSSEQRESVEQERQTFSFPTEFIDERFSREQQLRRTEILFQAAETCFRAGEFEQAVQLLMEIPAECFTADMQYWLETAIAAKQAYKKQAELLATDAETGTEADDSPTASDSSLAIAAEQPQTLLHAAQQFMDVYDYEQAIELLQQIPQVKFTHDAHALLEKASELQDEVTSIAVAIEEAVARNQHDHLIVLLTRLLELKPEYHLAREAYNRLIDKR